jgi:hypothetical protein
MDKRIAGLLGAAAALTTVGGADAATTRATEPLAAVNYSDLLKPVPNALALLRADEATRVRRPAGVEVAQYHHHHHHNGFYSGAVIGGVIGGLLAPPPPVYYGPPARCYLAPGRPYWNGYRWIRPTVRVCE